MTSPRLNMVDLCCGAGGSAMGFHMAAPFRIVGVDLVPQPNYPFTFRQDDIMELLEKRIDVFKTWADVVNVSPPCQAYSVTASLHDNVYPMLISPIRERLQEIGVPYIIENVENAAWDMKNPIMLCGSAFGLRVQRHRLFESNMPLTSPGCDHRWQHEHKPYRVHMSKGKYADGYRISGTHPVTGSGQIHPSMPGQNRDGMGPNKSLFWKSVAMGIDWMTQDEINEAIPPAYTRYLGRQVYDYLTKGTAA